MNMRVQIFLSWVDLISFRYLSRSMFAGPYGGSIFVYFFFWRMFMLLSIVVIFFYVLIKGSPFPTSLSISVSSCLFGNCSFSRCEGKFHGLFCIFLLIIVIEHLLICFLGLLFSGFFFLSLGKYLFRWFTHFWIKLFIFLD